MAGDEWDRHALEESIQNDKIRMRFTNDKMEFVISGKTSDITKSVPWLRTPPPNATQSVPGPGLGPPGVPGPIPSTAGAIRMDNAFFSNKGFNTRYSSPLGEYAHFGTAALEKRLEQAVSNWQRASPFDKPEFRKLVDEVKDEIKKERVKIAQETFYRDYTYSTYSLSIIPDTNESSSTMSIPLEFSSTRIENKDIMFRPVPNVTASTTSNSSDRLNVSGNSDDIRKLVESSNNYRVRVWFKSLRCRNNEVSDSTYSGSSVDADVLKIEIFDVR
jgi:hypothetical protein